MNSVSYLFSYTKAKFLHYSRCYFICNFFPISLASFYWVLYWQGVVICHRIVSFLFALYLDCLLLYSYWNHSVTWGAVSEDWLCLFFINIDGYSMSPVIFLSMIDNLILLKCKVTYSQILDSLNIFWTFPYIRSDNIEFVLLHSFYIPIVILWKSLQHWTFVFGYIWQWLLFHLCRYQGYFYLPSSQLVHYTVCLPTWQTLLQNTMMT